MRILFADAFPESFASQLAEYDVEIRPELNGDALIAALDGVNVLVVRSTKVTDEMLTAANALELIIRAGAGTNTIDVQGAANRGIYVSNVPGKNAIAVAELAMGLIGSIDRKIPDNVADLRDGVWKKKTYSKADGLAGKTLAIVGLGEIGMALAERAVGFGMNVVVATKAGRSESILRRAESAGVTFVDDDETLLADADIVSIHVPLNDGTRGLVNESFLSMCQDGAWIINTSRGETVNEADLIGALEERGMWAGLDVFADEPSSSDVPFVSALAQHPRVYGTHHIGASTTQAQRAIAAEVVDIIDGFAAGRVRNCVNLERSPLGSCTLVVRHADRVGVLSGVLAVLKSADANVKQMDNQIFLGAKAAVATIRVDCAVSDQLVADLAAVDHVFGVSVQTEES